MKPQSPHHSARKHFALFALIGGLLSVGGVAEVYAQDAHPAYDRMVKVLRFGAAEGNREPSKIDAVHALGLLGDPRAIPLLIEHLENESSDQLRVQIVRALSWFESPAVVPALEKALKDKYLHVRNQAALALKKITGKDYEFDRAGLPDPAAMQEAVQKIVEERRKARETKTVETKAAGAKP